MRTRVKALFGLLAGLVLLLGSGCSRQEMQTPESCATCSDSSRESLFVEPQILSTKDIPYKQEVVAQNLNVPWSLDIAGDGRIFFTERPGQIRVIENGRVATEPVISFPAPFASVGEGGLLGIVLDPNFSDNHYLYVYHSYEAGGELKNRVLRLVERGNKARVDKVLLDNIPGSPIHNGGRIRIGSDGYLYITTGDARDTSLAQDPSSLAGKILRIGLDGSIPKDNPNPGSPVYSLGHRNPQGLAWHPEDGSLYSSEHGHSAHDEINLIVPGGNYGWPLIQGDQGKGDTSLKRPLLQSGDTTWAPSGMTFVTKGPWKGQLLVANLRGSQLLKITWRSSDHTLVERVDTLFKDQHGRLRDIVEGPDGSLYLLTNNRDGRGTPREGDDKIIRLKPAF